MCRGRRTHILLHLHVQREKIVLRGSRTGWRSGCRNHPSCVYVSLDLWRVYFAEPQSPTGPKKRIQGGDCCPRRMSLLRFPWLFPIRNPFELRGLCRRSYFGPRTCGRSINHFSSKCSGFLIRVSPLTLFTPTMQEYNLIDCIHKTIFSNVLEGFL